MNDQPIKKQTFLQGTAVLAMATVLVKLMGFLFKVPLNNIIGEDGFGYFNTAYDVYNVLLMISTTETTRRSSGFTGRLCTSF